MEQNEKWLLDHFAGGVIPPFSFVYDGKQSSDFIKDWQFHHDSEKLGDSRTEHIFSYTDPETKLCVCCRCELFSDFPVMEWLITFENNGTDDTPIIEDIQAVDTVWDFKQDGEVILHRALGSSAAKSDFAPIDEVMQPNAEINLAPVGGRSSNTTVFPFFNIEAPGEGLVITIGWSGQWAISLVKSGRKSIKMRAGMELTHFRLHKSEKIRTPRIMLMPWDGDDRMLGHNMLRQFILKHHTLQKNGKPVRTPLACSGSQIYDIANKATEQNQTDMAKKHVEIGTCSEYLWLDAGWFEGGWPNGVGNWYPKKDAFPNGIGAVSSAIRDMGMGLILWFEPERVYQYKTASGIVNTHRPPNVQSTEYTLSILPVSLRQEWLDPQVRLWL